MITRIKLNQLFMFVLIAIVPFGITTTSSADEKDSSYKLDETYPISPTGMLTLVSNDAEVTITGSDRKDAHVKINYFRKVSGFLVSHKSDPFEMEIDTDGENLVLREVDGFHSMSGVFIMSSEDYTIDIEIPRGVSLKLRGDDDNYDIENIDGKISLRMEDGRARLKNCNGDNFDLETEDGYIDLKGGKGMLEAYTEDGRVTVEEGSFDEVEASSEDGSIEVATTLSDNGSYRFSTDDGHIYFHVIKGGGEFRIDFDDGHVRTSKAFELEEDDENYRYYSLPGGSSKVRIRIEDGVVRLSEGD